MVCSIYIVLEGQKQSVQLSENTEIDLCSFSLDPAFTSDTMRK